MGPMPKQNWLLFPFPNWFCILSPILYKSQYPLGENSISDKIIICKRAAMAEQKAVFDGEAAERTAAELRESYNSGKTRRYEWRVTQLKNLCRLMDENESAIIDAIHSDLSKPEFEAFAHEVTHFLSPSKFRRLFWFIIIISLLQFS